MRREGHKLEKQRFCQCVRKDVSVQLALLKFKHQVLVADIVNDVILGTDIMVAYRFVVDLRESVLRADQEKIKFSMAEKMGSTNHSIKRQWPKKESTGAEKPLLLNVETPVSYTHLDVYKRQT